MFTIKIDKATSFFEIFQARPVWNGKYNRFLATCPPIPGPAFFAGIILILIVNIGLVPSLLLCFISILIFSAKKLHRGIWNCSILVQPYFCMSVMVHKIHSLVWIMDLSSRFDTISAQRVKQNLFWNFKDKNCKPKSMYLTTSITKCNR